MKTSDYVKLRRAIKSLPEIPEKGNNSMKIAEIFYSLQGEGIWTGTPTIFIRLAGCSVRCKKCDTEYAWKVQSVNCKSEDVFSRILSLQRQYHASAIDITGGEPMDHFTEDVPEHGILRLIQNFQNLVYSLQCEVSGHVRSTDKKQRELLREIDFWHISPKLSNMGAKKPLDYEFCDQLISYGKRGELKFVVPTGIAAFHKLLITEILPICVKLRPPWSWPIVFQPQYTRRLTASGYVQQLQRLHKAWNNSIQKLKQGERHRLTNVRILGQAHRLLNLR